MFKFVVVVAAQYADEMVGHAPFFALRAFYEIELFLASKKERSDPKG